MTDDLVSPLIIFFENKNIRSFLLSHFDHLETTKENCIIHVFTIV